MTPQAMSEKFYLNIEPHNFIGFVFKSFFSMFIIMFLASIVFVLITPNLGDNYYLSMILAGLIVTLVLTIQFIIRPTIYLYSFKTSESETELKWQKNGKHKSQKFINARISAELMPSGKNSPYLKLVINDEKSELILKQYQIGKWNREKFKEIQKSIKNN